MECAPAFGVHAQKKTLHAKERDAEPVATLRKAFKEEQPTLPSQCLVFLDEAGFRLGTPPRYGWSLRGADCAGTEVRGSWTMMTMMGAVSLNGFRGFGTFDFATSGESFLAYVTTELCPALKPGDIVVMDNLASHKVRGVVEAIQAVGATVRYLPPYSPDLNPIEKLWSKLKEYLRRSPTLTRELFDAAVARAMDTISSSDIAGWFAHCGYSLTST